MTERKAKVQGVAKPDEVCARCGEPVTANPDGSGWRAWLHSDESKIYDHRPSVSA